jgi:hypothetical protein
LLVNRNAIQNKKSGIYNLAFGDINVEGEIDDLTISDNGDRNKILATVAKSVDEYTKRFPGRWIFFKGSTPERTRLHSPQWPS